MRRALDVVCLSHNTCCDIVFCYTDESRVRNKNFRARVIYVLFFFLMTLAIMLTRTYAELYLLPTFSSYECSASLKILTCFQVNMLLRISGALFVYHLILALLSSIGDSVRSLV